MRMRSVVSLLALLCAASASAQQNPLTLSQLSRLLRGGVPESVVLAEAQRAGLAFRLSGDAVAQMTAAGATPALLTQLRDVRVTPASDRADVARTPSGWSVELFAQVEAFDIFNGDQVVQLSPSVDQSTSPSYIDFTRWPGRTVRSLGVGFIRSPSALAVRFNLHLLEGARSGTLSLSYRPAFRMGQSAFSLTPSVTASGALFDFTVGTVGLIESDVNLQTASGESFRMGTRIHAWTLGYGGAAGLGLSFQPKQSFRLFLEGGYGWLQSRKSWNYALGAGYASDIDARGVPLNDVQVRMRGPVVRAGIGF